MKRYPKLDSSGIFEDGAIIIQEKVDGSNFRFTYDPDSGFTFGSRNYTGDDMNREQFEHAIEYVRRETDHDELAALEEEYSSPVYFGEFMAPHTLSYDWEQTPIVLGFDVWLAGEETFLDSQTVLDVFDQIGLPTVPVLDVVDVDEWADYTLEIPESQYGEETAEGVVLKNHATETYVKIVRSQFKERNYQRFGKPKKYYESDAERLSYQYITDQRIRKAIHRLIDEEGWELQMKMMEDLPDEVIRDMVSEVGEEIFLTESLEVDFRDFRSVTSRRCAEILRQKVDEETVAELRRDYTA